MAGEGKMRALFSNSVDEGSPQSFDLAAATIAVNIIPSN